MSKKRVTGIGGIFFKTEKFLKFKCRLFGKIGTYKMPKIKSFQIDDMQDLNIMKALAIKYL